jgi:hypothetical protein
MPLGRTVVSCAKPPTPKRSRPPAAIVTGCRRRAQFHLGLLAFAGKPRCRYAQDPRPACRCRDWTVIEHAESFWVQDASGQTVVRLPPVDRNRDPENFAGRFLTKCREGPAQFIA